VTLTNISATLGFTETNNCGVNFPTTAATLNVGQSCTISVSFAPTASGSVTGSVTISSNAVKSSTSLTLAGTGTPVFSLAANQRSTVLLIGATSAQFTISALGPSTMLPNSVVLSCGSGATCAFSPTSISAGGSSLLTVSGLSATSANPLNFTVTGTVTTQSASVSLTIFFADFSLSATPSGTTVSAGNNATYTISVGGINGFSQPVLLSCPGVGGIPVGTVCYWNPPSVLPSGAVGQTVSSTLTITTLAQSRLPYRRPPGRNPPGAVRWWTLFFLLLLSASTALWGRSRRRVHARLRPAILLAAIVLGSMSIVSCYDYVNPIEINPTVNGTPSGNYAIVLTGQISVGQGTPNPVQVARTTTVNLSVTP
jgi:hypothetical protein